MAVWATNESFSATATREAKAQSTARAIDSSTSINWSGIPLPLPVAWLVGLLSGIVLPMGLGAAFADDAAADEAAAAFAALDEMIGANGS